MTVTISPSPLAGGLQAIVSKSHAHRLLICAALSDRPTRIPCPAPSKDIIATVDCLIGMGAKILREGDEFVVSPIISDTSEEHLLDCGESGSTYRFLAPVVCAKKIKARFKLSGRLPSRPMDPLWTALEAHGAQISGKGKDFTEVSGSLSAGNYEIPGDISSQYISGLLFALPNLPSDSRLRIIGEIASAGYIQMTLDALKAFSVEITKQSNGYFIRGGQRFISPGIAVPEGDWSNAAFWLCAAAANSKGITLYGLDASSAQGDRAVCDILRRFGTEVHLENSSVTVRSGPLRPTRINADDIPDLVPALAVAAAAANGRTVIEKVERLRLKESDRVSAVCETLNSLGGSAEYRDDSIIIHGTGGLEGGTVEAYGDHRIAMMAAAASVICKSKVTVCGAEAVAKSYPAFFTDFVTLGGQIEQEDRL